MVGWDGGGGGVRGLEGANQNGLGVAVELEEG